MRDATRADGVGVLELVGLVEDEKVERWEQRPDEPIAREIERPADRVVVLEHVGAKLLVERIEGELVPTVPTKGAREVRIELRKPGDAEEITRGDERRRALLFSRFSLSLRG